MTSNSKKNTTNQVVKFDINDTVLDGVLMVLKSNSNSNIWKGTMTKLQKAIVRQLGKKRDLPRSPSALRIVLDRVVYRLRTRGVSVKFGRTTDHTRTRYVRFAL